MAEYQKQAIKSSLKKNYSVLKQALEAYYIDNGERITTSVFPNNTLKPTLKKYLNVIYDCGLGSADSNSACIPNTANPDYKGENPVTYKTYNGNNMTMGPFDDGQFVLNDGSLILLENQLNTNTRIYISVDVNGFGKGPNRLGRDLFMFQLTDNGELLPMGAKGTFYYNSADKYCSETSSSNMNGAGCTYKILQE